MKFEWDDRKREWTLNERKLDFADIAFLDWDKAITMEDVRQPYPETRYITYGKIGNRVMVLALCYRGEAIRVISLRKANEREKKFYDER